jgi:hypothetical protein
MEHLGVNRYVHSMDVRVFLDASAPHAVSRRVIVGWRTNPPQTGRLLGMARAFLTHVLNVDAVGRAETLLASLRDIASRHSPLLIEPIPLRDGDGAVTGYIIGVGDWLRMIERVEFVV